MLILGIETSCDETAAAVINYSRRRVKVLANVVSSQAEIHKKWGGVVPELAARQHAKQIIPVIDEALRRARVKSEALDLIAVTQGPGFLDKIRGIGAHGPFMPIGADLTLYIKIIQEYELPSQLMVVRRDGLREQAQAGITVALLHIAKHLVVGAILLKDI